MNALLKNIVRTWTNNLEGFYKPTSLYPLVALRIAFGFTMSAWGILMILTGRVSEVFSRQVMHFPYEGLEWMRPLPFWGMIMVFLLISVSAFMLAAGWFFRIAASTFTLLFAYVSFIDKASYLSYYYLVMLLAVMLIFSPAHRLFSIDLIRKPSLRVDYAPRWLLLVFKVQVIMVFFFAGMAKLNSDWLYSGIPVSLWLQDIAQQAGLNSEVIANNGWLAISLSWLLVVFDFILPHFLLDPKTSTRAFWTVVLVQILGMILLPTGIFPLLIVLSCTIFLPAEKIHRVVSGVSYFLFDVFQFKGDVFKPGGSYMLAFRYKRLFPVIAMVFLSAQVLLPVGMYLKMGSIQWADTAFHFSWDVRINHHKNSVAFYKVDRKTGSSVPIAIDQYLTPIQQQRLAEDPIMVKSFIHQLKSKPELRISQDALEIEALSCTSVNGRQADCVTYTDETLSLLGNSGYE